MEPNAKNDALDYFETATSLVRRWFTSMDAFIPNEDEIPKVTEREFIAATFQMKIRDRIYAKAVGCHCRHGRDL